MRREFMVPFAWALTVVGMICISADKKSGERKHEVGPVTVAVKSPDDAPGDMHAGIGDSVVWANGQGPLLRRAGRAQSRAVAANLKYHAE